MTPPRAAQRLVRGRGDEVCMRNRVGVGAASDQARVVGDVDHEQRAVFTGDAAHALEVDVQRVGRGAGHDQLGLVFLGQLFDLVVVQDFVVVQAIRDEVVQLARGVDRRAVRQVAAFGQAHAQHGVARLEHGHVHALVGLRARVGLHIGGFGAEDLLQAIDGQLLDHVHVFAAAVVALAGVAFGVLVRELRALGFHDGGAGVVLGRDQLDVLFLAHVFLLDGGPDIRVSLGQGEVAVKHDGGFLRQ